MLKFIAVLVAVAALLTMAYFLMSENQIAGWPGYFFQILAYIFLTTLIIYSLLYRVKQPDLFVRLYLLTMAVKLLGGVIFISLIILKDKSGVLSNTAFFIVSYILFTGVEVAFLHINNSRNRGPF